MAQRSFPSTATRYRGRIFNVLFKVGGKNMPRAILAFLCSLAFAADWPQWLGPTRDSISKETGLLNQWPKEGPKLLWRVTGLGDGYGAPAVAGGRVYLISN